MAAAKAEAGDDDDHLTCCHRITFFHPGIRDIIVTSPVSKCLGQRLTWANLFWMVTSVGMVLIGWAVLYFLLGDRMLPNNDVFGLYVLVIFSYWLGWSLSYIPYLNLPPVFGMLLAGLIVRNSGLYDIHEELGAATISKIRTFCLTFIVIRAGLQLSSTSLKRYPLFLAMLAIIPCSIEMLALTICCKYILLYPWDWSFMAGAILACMSPVVTVNSVLALAEKGYGEDKGLASILCTAATMDSVHMVSLFVICYSIVFPNDENHTEWWSYIPSGIRDFTLGILAGAMLGISFIFFPHRSYKYATWHRVTCLVLGCLMCTTATAKLTISCGGYVACLVMTFVAITGWKILSISFDARCIATYLTTLRTPLTWKERLFFVAAWLPKGTLQAALAPMAYERECSEQNMEKKQLALDIVRLSVLTILFLSPIGAFAITTSGPFLLNKITDEQYQRDRELSYLRILSLQPTPTRRQAVTA
ncbi:sodium/hydrogen exchanger 9B2 isoform X1 [Andrena cerasifolii]|uniref:sodium/hydrogen exchanger 9B2 isoform X1 n=1 Tax=Andrena cerasifolii TaxID=2819439 RepID=UPI004037C731